MLLPSRRIGPLQLPAVEAGSPGSSAAACGRMQQVVDQLHGIGELLEKLLWHLLVLVPLLAAHGVAPGMLCRALVALLSMSALPALGGASGAKVRGMCKVPLFAVCWQCKLGSMMVAPVWMSSNSSSHASAATQAVPRQPRSCAACAHSRTVLSWVVCGTNTKGATHILVPCTDDSMPHFDLGVVLLACQLCTGIAVVQSVYG